MMLMVIKDGTKFLRTVMRSEPIFISLYVIFRCTIDCLLS